MVLLPLETKKNGCILKQVKRTDKTALYSTSSCNESTKKWQVTGYEVFRIKIAPERFLAGIVMPERESMPSNEQFGRIAWTYDKLETAEIKFNKLEQNG